MIKIGDRIPDAILTESTEFGDACPVSPAKVSVAEASKGKRIVVFGLPGAYTPTCSSQHVPGYLKHLPELAAKMGIKQNYLYRVLPGLEKEGKLEKKGRGWYPKGA